MDDTEYFNDNFDQLDHLSDDTLWDILDNFTNEGNEKKDINTIIDKYNKCCSSCKSFNLVFTSSRGSYVCGNCGLESQEILDDGPEWSNYEEGKADSGRCGAPSNAFFPKSSLGTTINAPGYSKVKMLRNWGQVPYRERSLADVLNDIDSKCKKYKITKAVIDNAKILYKNVRETKHKDGVSKGKNVIIRGINRKQIIAACFYFGATLQKSPRSTKEVADIFDLGLKQISKGCRRFLEIMKDNFIVFDIKPPHGFDFIERFGSKLKLNKETIELAKTIANNTTRLDIASDHQATSIAAACLLFASNILEQNINKKLVSEIFKISDVTITKTYKKILPYQQFIISDEKTNKLCHKINLKFMIDNIKNDENENDYEDDDSVIDDSVIDDSVIDDRIIDDRIIDDSVIDDRIIDDNIIDDSVIDDLMSETINTESEIYLSACSITDSSSENKSTVFSAESETELLIKKLYANNNISSTILPNDNVVELLNTQNITLSDLLNVELDESDIVKKDNASSKKNKLIQLQQDRDNRKELNDRL